MKQFCRFVLLTLILSAEAFADGANPISLRDGFDEKLQLEGGALFDQVGPADSYFLVFRPGAAIRIEEGEDDSNFKKHIRLAQVEGTGFVQNKSVGYLDLNLYPYSWKQGEEVTDGAPSDTQTNHRRYLPINFQYRDGERGHLWSVQGFIIGVGVQTESGSKKYVNARADLGGVQFVRTRYSGAKKDYVAIQIARPELDVGLKTKLSEHSTLSGGLGGVLEFGVVGRIAGASHKQLKDVTTHGQVDFYAKVELLVQRKHLDLLFKTQAGISSYGNYQDVGMTSTSQAIRNDGGTGAGGSNNRKGDFDVFLGGGGNATHDPYVMFTVGGRFKGKKARVKTQRK